MTHRLFQWLVSTGMALILLFVLSMQQPAEQRPARESLLAARQVAAASLPARLGSRPLAVRRPAPAIEPYTRPGLEERLEQLRPGILAAAERHNRPDLSGMSDAEFAAAMLVILYNEQNGWLEDSLEPLRSFTPLYQQLQRQANQSPLGSNFSVWPANLRPSVALEILNQELPLADGSTIKVPVMISGSRIVPDAYQRRAQLYAAITAEISRDDLAIQYLAANLERALYRAAHENAPVTWRTLAAWHNQGLVDPQQIRNNAIARDYLRRAAAYLPLARAFVAGATRPRYPPQQAE